MSVGENNFQNTVIYPNPTLNVIEIKSSSAINKIEVYDVLGKIVKKTFMTEKINLKALEKGTYLIKIYSEVGVISKNVFKL